MTSRSVVHRGDAGAVGGAEVHSTGWGASTVDAVGGQREARRVEALRWTDDDLLLLGEPFAVELANTDRRTEREDDDVLAEPARCAAWFRRAPGAERMPLPAEFTPPLVARLRAVRDATRRLLLDAVDGRPALADEWAVEVLNGEAAQAPAHLVLGLGADGPTWWVDHHGEPDDVLAAMTATRCILFLGGEESARVRRCARPGCPMLFVQRHRARRYCRESCAHAFRQARYVARRARRPR